MPNSHTINPYTLIGKSQKQKSRPGHAHARGKDDSLLDVVCLDPNQLPGTAQIRSEPLSNPWQNSAYLVSQPSEIFSHCSQFRPVPRNLTWAPGPARTCSIQFHISSMWPGRAPGAVCCILEHHFGLHACGARQLIAIADTRPRVRIQRSEGPSKRAVPQSSGCQ